ncbi:hypothetical protein E2C01_053016 [Portunus trituberculatus]|uniref:Uncharacterized protein n=1 Tax=Portunus trituberculatus TaxID=210409 RepID=A0A5B7GG06_PORTR|nr:hypothetical protein [Portunus trituberculatus]
MLQVRLRCATRGAMDVGRSLAPHTNDRRPSRPTRFKGPRVGLLAALPQTLKGAQEGRTRGAGVKEEGEVRVGSSNRWGFRGMRGASPGVQRSCSMAGKGGISRDRVGTLVWLQGRRKAQVHDAICYSFWCLCGLVVMSERR